MEDKVFEHRRSLKVHPPLCLGVRPAIHTVLFNVPLNAQKSLVCSMQVCATFAAML